MEDAEINLRRLLGLVRRRIKLILLATSVSLCLSGLLAAWMAPIYSATTLLIFDPSHKNLLEPDARSGSGPADNALVESEVELLRSDAILRKVIVAENLAGDPDLAAPQGLRSRLLALFGFPPPPLSEDERLGQAVARLRSAVNVQRRGPTYLIAISVQAADAAQAARLANTIAQIHIDDQVTAKVASMLSSRDVLQARLAQARDEIVLSEASFNEFLNQSTVQLATLPKVLTFKT